MKQENAKQHSRLSSPYAGLLRQKRQAAFYPLPDRILHTAGPSREIQDVSFMGGQCRGAPKLRAQHLQRGSHRLLVVRCRGDPRKNIRHKGSRYQAVPVDALRHVGDEVAVTEMPLSLRHADQNKIIGVGDLDQPPVHPGKVNAHIIQHHSHFPALNEPQQIGTLPLHVIDAVEKAGNDDLTAGVFIMAKYLVDQDPRIGRLQCRDRRHNFFQSARSADNARLLQGRQLQQVGYCHTHNFTFFLLGVGLWAAFTGCSY